MMNRENKTISAIVPEIPEKYEAPVIEIHEVSVERGFAQSGLDDRGLPTW